LPVRLPHYAVTIFTYSTKVEWAVTAISRRLDAPSRHSPNIDLAPCPHPSHLPFPPKMSQAGQTIKAGIKLFNTITADKHHVRLAPLLPLASSGARPDDDLSLFLPLLYPSSLCLPLLALSPAIEFRHGLDRDPHGRQLCRERARRRLGVGPGRVRTSCSPSLLHPGLISPSLCCYVVTSKPKAPTRLLELSGRRSSQQSPLPLNRSPASSSLRTHSFPY
jgi:hypothetical protein